VSPQAKKASLCDFTGALIAEVEFTGPDRLNLWPDVIQYLDKTFVYRFDGKYREAVVQKIEDKEA
jgi:hypothetical protein